MDNQKKKGGVVALILVVLVVLAAVLILPKIYKKYLKANSKVSGKAYLYIPTNATYQQVLDSLDKNELLIDQSSFLSLAKDRQLSTKFKPGKYPFVKGMNNRQIVNMLIAGNQEPVDVSFRNIRLKENFAALASKKLEFDSSSFIHLLDSADFVAKYGFTKDNVYTMFIPNSYQMYWNISAKDFFERMNKEYRTFWTDERKNKAKEIGLSPQEVTILASIVDAEALMDKEMPTIAGLYLNRLNKGIKLEADPTVIFANNDFSIRRVLNRHLRKDSPYNTYMYKGLPPGPIMMPSIAAIDAVLNHENHNYIYMCAKEDFSGYHNFSDNIKDHQANAKRFQKALNERNIKK
ncbi:endolytic transglycosylase MltG [Pedobacter sp. SD-b]|uniref:Endolytic murein transglycosylase n=1 Tax=Pedobacter segetis TaxID=2793069 RepID=A0ABS1BG58_9SPHI|nr:endolytic transglycosylase MltG [Pedobacter segetis]MBK0381848.1 endolytic transglycosylase MltG [Pedobacter segetis]